MLVDNRLASYEVPHGVCWLLHVKVFNYAGIDGPTHFINVYLKSGGNHRWTQRDQLTVVKNIVAKILERDDQSRLVVLGDMNEAEKALVHHLNIVGDTRNYLFLAHFVGNRRTHFPLRGEPSAIDNILLTETSQKIFWGARVLRCYNSSDHRLVVMTPYADVISAMQRARRPAQPAFDNKMICLKGDMIVNDNTWTKLMQHAYDEVAVDGDHVAIATDEQRAEVSAEADKFIATFDKVCCKHDVKKVHRLGSRPEFPRKLKLLQQTVHRYSKRYHTALDCNRTPDESTCIRLAWAQTHFKKAKKAWQVRMRQQFYSRVADDFVAHDHKNMWNRLRAQVSPSLVVDTVNPVKDKEGVLHHSADRILQVMKDHYADLLTYDPKGLTSNHEHWAMVDLGEEGPELVDLNDGLGWPEILLTIRGMNRNTAPGKDEIHINVLKIMVGEECMAALKKDNPKLKRPDDVFVDLSENKVKKELVYPLTHLGKSFHALLNRTWQSGCIPEQWQEVHIVNLFKGGDSESTNNYRGISLMSCALKVLLCLMANRLSLACEGNGLLCDEQAGFRPREEAVAQAIALAKIVRRRFLEGRPTLGTFIDFQKAYDRVYHVYLFRLLNHVGVCGRFLRMVVESYTKTKYAVRVGSHLSASFTPTRGAKQGDPLSPVLFDIFINSCLKEAMPNPSDGVLVNGVDLMRCHGLMYANAVVTLSDSVERAQAAITGIYDWGQKFGMDLGRGKCGVLIWLGKENPAPRRRINRVLDLEDDYEPEAVSPEELLASHLETVYSIPEGAIPTVEAYKYLGITMDGRLGDPRKIVTGEKSMEYEFALLQSKKGMRQLHTLRPFLTDRFCPIHLKVALVRNLIYLTMLYGAEFIGFQKLHADPLQHVINMAAKWITGLHRHNTSTDSFSMCYELGLPPISLEMSAARARLGCKLDGHPKLKTWIQQLWDNPASYATRHLTWVTQTKKWLEQIDREKHKYAWNLIPRRGGYHVEGRCIVEEEDGVSYLYFEDSSAPLRHWAQIGRCIEMRVRSNRYRFPFMDNLIAEFIGETATGAPLRRPVLDSDTRLIETWWTPSVEYSLLEEGTIIPSGQQRDTIYKVLLVRHVELERLMSAQRTKSWGVYDTNYYGILRAFLREAVNHTDLSEGVRWLVLMRTKAFPSVERAWQRITQSGKVPGFARNVCPLCNKALISGMEQSSHLLVACESHQVVTCRRKYLEQHISYLDRTKAHLWEGAPNVLSDRWGIRDGSLLQAEAMSVYLLGGLVRLQSMTQDAQGWFDSYQLGFGHFRLVTPRFTAHHYIFLAQFLQEVAPLWSHALEQEMYDSRSDTDSLSHGSLLEGDVNLTHTWLDRDSAERTTLLQQELLGKAIDVDDLHLRE